jgi:FkbM family methyltransferase
MEASPADPLFELLRPDRPTAVVDIGANPIDGDPPYKGMLKAGLCTVIGFEPQEHALAELNRLKGPNERYLSHAIGDGRKRTLHICRAKGMTSLLSPDPDHLALFNEFPRFGQVEREVPVATVRLDDIDEIQEMDFLKIDIQGSELEVFRTARRKLARTVVIQTEVSFITLYRDQPTIGEVDSALRELGFVPHCFAQFLLCPIAPAVIDRDPRKPVRQVVEADLVYVRDFSRAENLSVQQWKHLAMVAHHCYGSVDLALRGITAATKLGGLQSDAPQRYIDILRPQESP